MVVHSIPEALSVGTVGMCCSEVRWLLGLQRRKERERTRKVNEQMNKQTDDVRVGCGYCVPKVQRGETFDDDVC